ncbi:hypothetical protein M514_11528 [Trichuris suis]|uniref:Transcription factor CBF/NF-Y/archaeal histone domain-containing protein n=1 Tax=Trichuris suis TaxID=68888 RepID=A0A085NDU2_9BILA|nr:hypothetical protein M514_11528 [Trichuris suis]
MMSQSKLTNKSRSDGESRRARIPPVKVKRVLQSDEDIGKMSNAVPIVFAKLLEHFIEQVLLRTDEVLVAILFAAILDRSLCQFAPLLTLLQWNDFGRFYRKLAAEREPSLNFLLPLFAGITEVNSERRRTMPELSPTETSFSTERHRKRRRKLLLDDAAPNKDGHSESDE